MAFGLTAEGFVPMTLTDLREAINAQVWARISPTLDLSDRSYEGQVIGIVSEFLQSLWELTEKVNSSQDPDKAVDAALDALCILTGTLRRGASASTVTLTLTGDNATLVPSGSAARVPSGTRFDTVEDATLVTTDSWTTGTAHVIGDRVTANNGVYQCTTSGTSAGSGTGPSSVDPLADITDGTTHWRFLGAGTADIDVGARATETGPLAANSGTITEIVTPVSGWSGAVNVLDATPGENQMRDAELRNLREFELAQPGTSPADAIRAALLALDDVTTATVFTNNTDTTDADGVPSHSIEVMVQGGADQDIWDALLANVAAGVRTYGTEDGTATDSQGTEQDVSFTRPEEIEIYVQVTLAKDATTYPTDGDDQVAAAIVAWGDAQATGKNAVASRIGYAAFDVDGVLDVSEVRVYSDVIATGAAWTSSTAYVATVGSRSVVTNGGRSYICITSGTSAGSGGPSGTGTDITDGTAHWRYLGADVAISLRQLALYDTSRITVVSSDATP